MAGQGFSRPAAFRPSASLHNLSQEERPTWAIPSAACRSRKLMFPTPSRLARREEFVKEPEAAASNPRRANAGQKAARASASSG